MTQTKLLESLNIINYKYQLTFGLYMLEPWERAIFNTIVVLLGLLCLYAFTSQLSDMLDSLLYSTTLVE